MTDKYIADRRLLTVNLEQNGNIFSHSYWTRIVLASNGIKKDELHRHSYYELLVILNGEAV